MTAGLRVLAITADQMFLRQVRLVLPLDALCRAGLVSGFRVLCPTDASLSDHYPLEHFDAVLVQRCVPAWVADLLHHRAIAYQFDLDDLLLARPAYAQGLPDAAGRERLAACLAGCAVLTVPNHRLLAALERRLGLSLAAKTAIVPNALPGGLHMAKPASRPGAILWASSDRPALGPSFEAVAGAIADTARRHSLPVLAMGRLGPDILAALPGVHALGNMGYWRHKAFLRDLPTALAVAPLETGEAGWDAETLDFIACKSDVKLVEYGGLGHAGVYSRALPYTDSDLAAGRLVDNDRHSWTEALAWQLAEGYRQTPAEARDIQAKRNADAVARECWWPALTRVRLARPLALADVLAAYRAAGGAAGPLHHQLADRLYHGLYRRLAPAGVRRLVGRLIEARLARPRR